jgi:hypothetical protein
VRAAGPTALLEPVVSRPPAPGQVLVSPPVFQRRPEPHCQWREHHVRDLDAGDPEQAGHLRIALDPPGLDCRLGEARQRELPGQPTARDRDG